MNGKISTWYTNSYLSGANESTLTFKLIVERPEPTVKFSMHLYLRGITINPFLRTPHSKPIVAPGFPRFV